MTSVLEYTWDVLKTGVLISAVAVGVCAFVFGPGLLAYNVSLWFLLLYIIVIGVFANA